MYWNITDFILNKKVKGEIDECINGNITENIVYRGDD